ncbi:hypothetical protein J6590_064648 [Homalodisca vitripennis]|nr:hypothetical protein J6590_064648 [Homalodisca vitripennis]
MLGYNRSDNRNIHKTGHSLEEIRARALYNIVSKLDYKLITEDELVDKDCIFQNLVKWFQFKNAPAKEDVLKLIIRLLKHGGDDAVALLLRADPGLAQLREVTDCDVLVQDIVNLTSAQVNSARYARSNGALDSARTTHAQESHARSSGMPDSARTSKATSAQLNLKCHGRSSGMPDSARTTKATSTKLNLESHARSSGMPDSARSTNIPSVRSSKTADSSNEPKSARLRMEQFVQKYKELPLYNPNEASSLGFPTNKIDPTPTQPEEESSSGVLWSLPSISLVASDLNVISAVEDSLKLLASVTHTCHFFSSVIIRDFPPEVFLQHPGVIRQLLRLTKKSAPVNVAAVECLAVYTRRLLKQLVFSSQLEFTSLKFQSDAQGSEDFTDSSARSSKRPVETSQEVMQKYLEEGYLSSGSDHQTCAPNKTQDIFTIPQYCLETLVAAVELVGRIPQASSLVLQALSLLQASVPDPRSLWHHLHLQLHHLLRALLAAITQQIKLSVSQEAVVELHVTVCWLRVLDTLVPPQLAPSVLPTELQDLVCEALLNPVLAVNYNKLHTMCVAYATVLQRKGTEVYEEVSVVMDAMRASMRFSREAPNMAPLQALESFRDAIPALPYHQDLSIIKEFTQYLMERRDLCEEEIDFAAQLTRSLLAHSEKAISVETYRVLHDIVALMLGPRQVLSNVDPCPRLGFLINTPVLVEITCHGVTNADNQVRQNAEDILLLLLKCQMLVADDSWQRLVEQLTPVLPLLQCHASKGSPLGRAALHMLDPDMASSIGLSHLQVLLGNARLLLHKEPLCREEAATRLLWLAKLHHLPHKRLADVCVLDVAITGHTPVTGMYEVGSVVRVLEVLSAPCVEARVKQSALTQLSVMTEDSRLHQVFIEEQGVELFISILKNVMVIHPHTST